MGQVAAMLVIVRVLDSGSAFHVCPRRDWFYSLREVSDGTVTAVDGEVLPIAGVGDVRFRMWDGVVRTVTGVKYVPGVRRSLVSLGELDTRGCEIRARGGSMELLRNDKVVIRGTKRGGVYYMVGTVESASTVVSTDTSASDMRPENPDQVEHLDALVVEAGAASGTVVVGTVPELAIGCGEVALCMAIEGGAAGGHDVSHCIETAVVGTRGGGGWLGRRDPCGRLDAGGGRRGPVGHVACDVMWGVGPGRPRAVESGLTR